MGSLMKGLLVAVISLTLVACANLNYRPPVQNSAVPDLQKGYVYGKFSLDSDFMNKVRLALQLENKNSGKIMSLRLLDAQQVYAIEAEPGVYQLKGFIYALLGAVMAFETTEIPLPDQPAYLKTSFTVEAGKAYYLGDYYGASRRTGFMLTPAFVSTTFRGGIVGIQQNFSATTEELKKTLPQMKNVDSRPAWEEALTKSQ